MASKFGLIKHPQTEFFSFGNKSDLMSDDDDSWEVVAFEEDNALGCTWPPRSYSCSFCRREFRSAQALGGHMNVHRRDRARLLQQHDAPPPPSPAALLIPSTVLSSNGFCFLYPNPNPPINYTFPPPPPPSNKPNETAANSVVSSLCHSEPSASNTINHNNYQDKGKDFGIQDELDLELRLGRRAT